MNWEDALKDVNSQHEKLADKVKKLANSQHEKLADKVKKLANSQYEKLGDGVRKLVESSQPSYTERIIPRSSSPGCFNLVSRSAENFSPHPKAISKLRLRLQTLLDIFKNIHSPGELTYAMSEGGALYYQLMHLGLVPGNDLLREYGKKAKEDADNLSASGLSDFTFSHLFLIAADWFSERRRLLLRPSNKESKWVITRSTQAAGEPVPTVTTTPANVVVMNTEWHRDYSEQGVRYAMFVSELLAYLEENRDEKAKTEDSNSKGLKPPSREMIRLWSRYIAFLNEYRRWQEEYRKRTGRKRPNERDWLLQKKDWPKKSKDFFKELCGSKDQESEKDIVDNAIRYARKIEKEKKTGGT